MYLQKFALDLREISRENKADRVVRFFPTYWINPLKLNTEIQSYA